jgi:hypothetical protein
MVCLRLRWLDHKAIFTNDYFTQRRNVATIPNEGVKNFVAKIPNCLLKRPPISGARFCWYGPAKLSIVFRRLHGKFSVPAGQNFIFQ